MSYTQGGVATAPLWLQVLAAGLRGQAARSSEAGAIAVTVDLLCDPLPFGAAWYGPAELRTRSMRALYGSGLLHGMPTAAWSVPSFAKTTQGSAIMTERTVTAPCDAADKALKFLGQSPASLGLDFSSSTPVFIGSELGGVLTVYGSGASPAPSDLTLLQQIATDLGRELATLRGRPATDGSFIPESELPGFLTTVANAQVAPVIVVRALREAGAAVSDFETVEANAVGVAVSLLRRSELLGARGTAFLAGHDTRPLQTAILQALRSGFALQLEDLALQASAEDEEHRFDVNMIVVNDLGILTFRDVTERFQAMAQAEQVSQRDHLTKLGSREVLVHELHDVLGRPRRRNTGVAVLQVGIDGLSRVNEALSLAAGDLVIQAVAERLVAEVGTERFVGRLSGDEFAVILSEERGPDAALAVAERIQARVNAPLTVFGQQTVPSVSIGIVYTSTDDDPEQLLHVAGLALSQAKSRGRGRVEFADSQLAVDAKERLALEHHIREGIAAKQFRAWHQPIVDLETRAIRGYEALARWESPFGEAIGPARFIPIAEASGSAPDIDLAMLDQSLHLMHDLPRDQFVSVNVSVASLSSAEYLVAASTLLAASGIDLHQVHLEITETALVGDLTNTVAAMERLASYGPRWFLDDFGTGFSSLSHLRDLPVAGLKLDMSFTKAVQSGDANATRLTQGVVGLAKGLELETIAEGIDSDQIARTLRMQGWSLGQGYLFGRAERLQPAAAD
ncbi:MAG: putative bifunctional diguanylate cyclase/phosphodiesterase [Candidatus Nanopelagicales bacterium]